MSAGTSGNPNRQKMINLMYLVFIAMVALNVSGEVLEGFEKVGEGLDGMLQGTERRNRGVAEELNLAHQLQPEKSQEAFNKGKEIQTMADKAYDLLEKAKQDIVQKSDGKPFTSIASIRNKDDMNAPSAVMLNPINKLGEKVRKSIESFRELVVAYAPSQEKQEAIKKTLATERKDGKNSVYYL